MAVGGGAAVIFRGVGNYFGDVLRGLKIKSPLGRGIIYFIRYLGYQMCSIGFCFY